MGPYQATGSSIGLPETKQEPDALIDSAEVLLIELPFLCAQNFKAEHRPVVWSRVLYRARLFLPDG